MTTKAHLRENEDYIRRSIDEIMDSLHDPEDLPQMNAPLPPAPAANSTQATQIDR